MPNFLDEMAAQASEVLSPNRFKMSITFPSIINAQAESFLSEYFILAAEVPSKTIGTIEIPVYGGHKLKVPGDVVVPDFTFTVMQDPLYALYRAFKRWHEYMNSIQSGLRAPDITVFGSATIKQLNSVNQTIQSWELFKIFPTDPGAIPFDKNSTDEFVQYDVSLAVNDIITELAF